VGILSGKGRADPQPTDPVSVLLASTGGPFGVESLRLARDLADGLVGVLVVARIYGTQFGMPNPGLLPTVKERQTAQDRVEQAIKALRKMGVDADGQVLITRHPAAGIARVAQARSARQVVLEAPVQGGLRKFVEGNFEASVQRKVGPSAQVISATGKGSAS
jgi:hypothetical protein